MTILNLILNLDKEIRHFLKNLSILISISAKLKLARRIIIKTLL